MIQSDALSREDHTPEEDTDNEDITMLPNTMFVWFINEDMHDLFAQNIMKDDIVKDAITALKMRGTPPIKSSLEDWKVENGLLFFKDRCYVPDDTELRRRLVKKYHETLLSGHPGQWQTTELLRRDYWWPGMVTFIKKYIAGCATCQQMKVNTHPTTLPLSPIKSDVTRPFALVMTDFITDLPESDGSDSLMVVVDHGLMKGVILIPCNKMIDALGASTLYLDNVYKRFRLPDKIISDRDPCFASQLFQECLG